ncbi:MAG: 4Fe-4S binding protein [Chitinivibrionales bacterium]|nr:4Fe-4S binding protein [Chitinivibrionales bacterium]MBD3396481.1 4Fe-4S binding protein [Chitinivibrionales bacterium]
MKFPALYFNWLQKDNPTGTVDMLPEIRDGFETSVPGIYCTGDLTGIPLIKLAAESGYDLIEKLHADSSFRRAREGNTDSEMLDLVICGAGPSGMAACMRAQELGYTGVVLESSQKFNTIVNFPAGKPIYVTPVDPPMKSALDFSDGTKETLLAELHEDIKGKDLPVHEGEMVQQVIREQKGFTVKTTKGSYRALRVIVAIGKTGNARMLDVPGEKLPKVFTRLIDPGEYQDADVLVVGGGDSALEAAVALAREGNRVTLSYRKASFSRPKEHNVAAFDTLARQGKITAIFESTVKEIREDDVVLNTSEGEKTLPNQAVFALIGTEIPIRFFRRSNIRMEGDRDHAYYMKFSGLLLFASVLYFGKKAPDTPVSGFMDFFGLPAVFLAKTWPRMLNGMIAWTSFMALLLCLGYLAVHFAKNASRYFNRPWNSFKYSYYAATAVLFAYLYVAYKLAGQRPVFGDMGGWYTLMYSLTIVVFGFRRVFLKPTGYITRQTYVLMAFQVVPLFILPMFIFPWMGTTGLFNDWIMQNVFPGESYWRAYGLILAWPLFIHNLAMGEPTLFWLVAGIGQTFLIIPWLNYVWGKGAYCGWICSCGALAETLGDEYRTTAFHGSAAKKADNAGQVVLWGAGFVTLLAWLAGSGGSPASDVAGHVYNVVVDIFFAGVLGLGVYFFWSGRVWCRFLCPLAALMHIYTRFSKYRIMSNKKRCISCNICTKVCHMGIDVMSYANKGIPMNDVECVRCSACVVNCPLQVLTFGDVGGVDLDNSKYKEKYFPLKRGWEAGLPKEDIEMLLREESEKHPEVISSRGTGARKAVAE